MEIPTPGFFINNMDVIVEHDMNIGTGLSLYVFQGSLKVEANLQILKNVIVQSGGTLSVIGGEISLSQGTFTNYGTLNLNKGVVKLSKNFNNSGSIQFESGCVTLTSQNFVNSGSLDGEGSIIAESGNIFNIGDWATSVIYCASGIGSNIPVAEDCNEADAICNCAESNCDIIPGYNTDNKVLQPIGPELFSLSQDSDQEPPVQQLFQINDNDEVLIEIVVLENQYNSIVTYLSTFGISPDDFYQDQINSLNDELLITVFFPISALELLNQQTDLINFARPVSTAFTNTGLIDSPGDLAQGSFCGRDGWDLDGEGIKIGVISNSFATRPSDRDNDINNDDLPGDENPVVVVEEYPFGVASDEGRAMLQIVHDIAPASQLFFQTGFISEGNLAFGIRRLREEFDCDIIVDDVQYITEPFYRDGIVAKAIDEVVEDGGMYFSAAGNFGSRSYSDTFTPAPFPNINRHDFGGGEFLQSVELGTGEYIIVLQWEDEFYSLGSPNGASIDLDIYLVEDDGTILYGFNRDNNGDAVNGVPGGDPIEVLPFSVVSPTTSNIMIEMDGFGPMPNFKYVVFRAGDEGIFETIPSLSQGSDASTIVGHANSDGATAIGAVRYTNTPAFGGTLELESFSSTGGTPVNGQIRQKPELVTANGVNTSVDFGSLDLEGDNIPNFFGTSAAAPHAAAAAALLMDAQNKFGVSPTPNPVDLMINTAIDMEDTGFDFNTGFWIH